MTSVVTSERATATRTGISIRHLDKSYGPLDVLENLDLDLAPDRVYGLLGPNGAGKTTLMSVICNHTFRSGGTILIDGANPAENAPVLARTCFIREDQLYNDAFSVASILATMPAFYPGWDEALCQRLVARFRLPIERSSRKLSRGQKSALAIVILDVTGAGLFGILVPLWFFIAACGFSFPCVQVLALANHGKEAGTAASLLGAVNFGVAGILSPIVGLFGITNAVPMGIVMAATAIVAIFTLWFVVQPRTVPALTH